MNQRFVTIGKYVAMLGLGMFLLWLVMRKVDDPKAFWEEMQTAELWSIGLSVAFGYLAIMSRGWRWLLLLRPLGHRPKRFNSVNAVAFGYFSNTFIPRSGEVTRCAMLKETDDVPVDESFGTVITERVIDMAMLIVLMSVTFLTQLDLVFDTLEKVRCQLSNAESPEESGFPWMRVILGLLALLSLLLWLKRKSLVQSKMYKRALGLWEGIKKGFLSIRNMEQKWPFIGHTVFIWVMYYLMSYVIFMGMDGFESLSPAHALFIMLVGGLGIVIPVPGGLGSYQLFVSSALMAIMSLGCDALSAMAGANVVWSVQTSMIILTGGIGYLYLMAKSISKKSPQD